MSPNEEQYKALGRLGFTGPLPNRILAWLQDGGATSGVIDQAWREFLTTAGYTTGIRQKDWDDYLTAQGVTGTLNEKEVKYWQGVGV